MPAYVEKFCEVTLPSPKVISAHTLNFGLFFYFYCKKWLRCPCPQWEWVSKPWPFSST